MLVHTAHLTCRADVVDSFRARLLRHAVTTLAAEPGCTRFDVHQDREDPTRFFLLEHYADDAALQAHRDSPHYLAFRADTKDWVVDRKWWFWQALSAGP
ncbi:MAG: putative quinol monooxygenase [Alphaproteobacteria bacterium]